MPAPRLGLVDGLLLTVGAVIGTGIFLTPGEMAKVLPHPGLLLAVWIGAGLIILAGALTYAELGALHPKAGGIYHFLDRAYGPLWGFLYGWTCFWIIMTGGIAAIATGFGEYLAAFVPFLSPRAAAVLAILALTAVNAAGVRESATVQNVLTVVKVLSLALFVALGALAEVPEATPATPQAGGVLGAAGLAMIAALWAYDGWYALTLSAGELRAPGRDLPRAMVAGVVAVVVIYSIVNVVILRALPMDELTATPRAAEAAALALFGPLGGKLLAAAILVSAFGCLSATIFYSARLYGPLAERGLFFRALAVVDARHGTPVRSLWWQSAWACVLVLSGTYAQLYTYVTFAAIAFHVAAGASIFILRRKEASAARPYRTWGYPVVPLVFVAASAALVVNTLVESPRESLVGVGLMVLGLPAYAYWRRAAARTSPSRQAA